ncbi:putative nuclease HARBI1 [Zophobas morio]|uniref:putative nuclease HARBI1 n=1 Tax=Zophobas morio TaxID=2755281 RepID=UPI003083A144
MMEIEIRINEDEEDVEDVEVLDFIFNGLPRQLYTRHNHFDTLDDAAFRRRFRLSRACVLDLLISIERELEFPSDMNNAVSPMNQILTCLRVFSTGGHLQNIADFMGMHLSTVSRIVKRVSEAIARLYRQHIKFPSTNDEMSENQRNFFSISGFPKVVGAIDCTHVKIQSPGGVDGEIYRNRKQYFSINTQVICDANLKIMNVVARWPGSAHDSNIFNHSRIKDDFEDNVYPNCLLLGHSGYANGKYLVTPLLNPRTPPEQLYNESHIRTRNVIERCFGVLKRRFPILAYGCRLKVDTCLIIIVAASVLHNLVLRHNDNVPPPLPELVNEEQLERLIQDGQIVAPGDIRNRRHVDGTRDFLIQNYFGNL